MTDDDKRAKEYEEFLRQKMLNLPDTGITREMDLGDHLFPHQRAGVRWALRKGRGALFFDTGLGKAHMQLMWCHEIAKETNGLVILLAPLAVSEQTVNREAPKFGIPAKIVESQEECEPGVVNVTNYEKLHRFDPSAFTAVCLDESSILKALDGKTKEAIISAFAETRFRLACSATPSPNDHMELGNHAEFLGVMTRAEMLAMFFVHDGGDTSKWRLKEHARDSFWRWVASWGLMVKKPSDLGFDDEGYNLPPLKMHKHVVEMPADFAQQTGSLVAIEAKTLTERRAAKRASLPARVQACAARVNDTPGQWMIWCHLNDEADALEKAIAGAVQVAGSDKPEDKKKRMLDFADGKIRVLISKPKIAGFGMNWQNCCQTAFVGLNESHEQLYQCIRRFYRFGQKNAVDVHLYLSEAETATLRDLETKESKAEEMASEMVAATRQIAIEEALATKKDVMPYKRDVARGKRFTLYLGDSVETIRSVTDKSIDYTIFSPPFASLYTYSNSERDMGNCVNHEQFYNHFRFLCREILRTTKPGRLCSFHCMDLPTSKARDGFTGLTDFRGVLLRAFQDEGWIFHSQVTIWKDPVTAMQRTKAKGLLYKQLRGDSTESRQGIPDYLVNVRAPGEPEAQYVGDYQDAIRSLADVLAMAKHPRECPAALQAFLRLHADVVPSYLCSMKAPGKSETPVKHTPEEFSLDMWQKIASPIWMDINPSDTLQYRSAREAEDERHICPLQTEVIRRGVFMYSNPGDTVASWFAGIGSEGDVALEMGREFVGCELKESYWKQAAANLREREKGPAQLALF